ncbi:hypothetical protein Tco_0816781 [Tanacetum coccineum]
MIVSLIFLEGLDDEAWVEAIEEQKEEEDDEENGKDDYLIKMGWIIVKTYGTSKNYQNEWGKECLHERYLRHSHYHLHRRDERMVDDQRRRKRKQKWKEDLFSCHNPFASFTYNDEREEA